MIQKIEFELNILKPYRIAYELILSDNTLAKSIEKFYTVHLKLIREWGRFDEKRVKLHDEPGIFCYLPENFLQDMIDVMTEIIKVNQQGHKAFSIETIINTTEFCLTLLRTDS